MSKYYETNCTITGDIETLSLTLPELQELKSAYVDEQGEFTDGKYIYEV